jgi:predicted ribonuclease YlaK
MVKTPNTEKRKLKTEPKLLVDLNEEQKQFVELFYQYDVNFLLGDFGSGKSLAAVHTALKAFRKKQFDNIWITRPMLANKLGALPGEISDKLQPYVYPIIQNLEVCQGKEMTEKMQKEGLIKIMPIEVAKGVTFMKSIVIVDEFQDMTYQDFRTILTRLGKGSKMIFCGSLQQIDKQLGKNSCIHTILKLENSNIVGFKTLTANHRNPILTDIIKYLEND